MEPTVVNNGNGNSTTNTVLIILLVIVVGLIVWYFTAHRHAGTAQDNSASGGLQINLGGSSNNSAPSNQ